MSEPWFVYIIRCKDGKLYTGIAKDVQKRVDSHNRGTACRFTKYRYPVELLYSEQHSSQGIALKREAEVKKFSRTEKLLLIEKAKSS